MKRVQLLCSVCVLLLLNGQPVNGQVPDGGIRLNTSTGTTFQQIGQCVASAISVSGQPFTEGIRVSVGSNINNSWDAQLKFPAVEGIEEGDVLLVAFYARTIDSQEETGESSLNVIVENNTTYAKQISHTITIGNEWKQYYASAVSETTLGTSGISYLFHLGFPNQTLEVADVQYLNFKQTLSLEDLPVTEITYFGQAPDADWRVPAAERINLHRKGDAELTVYDVDGNLLEGAQLEVEMVQHQFGFGTAISAREFNSNELYRNKALEVFNEVVFENDLKWPQFNPGNTGHISRAMDTLDVHHIPIRGHNVIWPSYRFLPNYIEGLGEDELALKNAINNHIDEVTQYTNGRLNDWDVINEPYSEHDMQDILGDEVMADWFKRVRKNDRDVKLYLNDYWILSGGGKNTVKQDYYYNLVQYIDNLGGGVQGIGMQGHFGTELTAINKVYSILDRFAALGKDIKITEFDVNTTQRGVQADYTRDFLTICFSHPSVKSVLTWGFWEGRHWKPEAAFFDLSWNLLQHGQQWVDLIYNQWWTPIANLTTDVSGKAYMDGFLGTYRYKVTSGDLVRTGTFTLDSSIASGTINEIVISMDENFPQKVVINSSIPGFLCEGETTSLSTAEGIGLSYRWFRNDTLIDPVTSSIDVYTTGTYQVEVSKGGFAVLSEPYSVEVNPLPEASITAEGELTFCEGGSVTLTGNAGEGLSYTWMRDATTLESADRSLTVTENGNYNLITTLNNCSSTSDPVIVEVLSATDPDCTNAVHETLFRYNVWPNPFSGSFFVEVVQGNHEKLNIELLNQLGQKILEKEFEAGSGPIRIPVNNSGIFILRIYNNDYSQAHRISGL